MTERTAGATSAVRFADRRALLAFVAPDEKPEDTWVDEPEKP